MPITFREMTEVEAELYNSIPSDLWGTYRTAEAQIDPKYADARVWATDAPGLGIVVDGADYGGSWGMWIIAEGSSDLQEVLEAWRRDSEAAFSDAPIAHD